MVKVILGIALYLVWGIAYAIDFFHTSYEELVQDEGMRVGEFFGLTVLTGIIWPLCIIIFAIMDLRDER